MGLIGRIRLALAIGFLAMTFETGMAYSECSGTDFRPVCADVPGVKFMNLCWLKSYGSSNNEIIKRVPEEECEGLEEMSCPCGKDFCSPIHNPICAYDAREKEYKSFHNLCDFKCASSCNSTLGLYFVKCGPCEVSEEEEAFKNSRCLSLGTVRPAAGRKSETWSLSGNPSPKDSFVAHHIPPPSLSSPDDDPRSTPGSYPVPSIPMESHPRFIRRDLDLPRPPPPFQGVPYAPYGDMYVEYTGSGPRPEDHIVPLEGRGGYGNEDYAIRYDPVG